MHEVICDKCKKPCSEVGTAFYEIYIGATPIKQGFQTCESASFNVRQHFKQLMVRQHFCKNCIGKIENFIDKVDT